MPESFTKKWLIICEGESDKGVFSDLIGRHRLSNFQISVINGIHKLSSHLRQISLNEEFIQNVKAILILADNDDDPQKSFKYVQSQIREAGYTAPTIPLQPSSDSKPVVVLMMPWTNRKGTLETLCMGSLYTKWRGIKRYLDDYMAETPAGQWGLSKQSKMRMQCVIAATCKEDPNTPLRFLFNRQKIYRFSTGHKCFKKVATLLKEFDRILEGTLQM